MTTQKSDLCKNVIKKKSLSLILWASNVVYYFDGQTQTVSF